MSNETIIKALRALTISEAVVLYWKCKGLTYKEIEEEDLVGVKVVRITQYMSSVYRKLNAPLEHSSIRKEWLKKNVCPLMYKMVDDPDTIIDKWPPDDKDPKPDQVYWPLVLYDQGVEDGIEEIESQIIKVEPAKIDPPPPPPPPPPPVRRNWLLYFIGAIALISVIACIALGSYLYGRYIGSPPPPTEVAAIAPEEIIETEVPVIVEPTEAPTEVIEPTIEPTDVPTPLPPTNTPAPSIALPFADNFDAGMKSEWKTIYGNWYTADGKLTVFEERLKWQFVVLDDPTWTNYKISLDTHIPVLGSANQGEVSIIIRYSRLRQEQIYFYLGRISGAGWVVGNPQEIHPKYISERENRASIQDDNHIQLEAYGNNFTAYMNGSFVQTISINGFENGGVMLGIRCNNEGSCPSIDNVLIEPIN